MYSENLKWDHMSENLHRLIPFPEKQQLDSKLSPDEDLHHICKAEPILPKKEVYEVHFSCLHAGSFSFADDLQIHVSQDQDPEHGSTSF